MQMRSEDETESPAEQGNDWIEVIETARDLKQARLLQSKGEYKGARQEYEAAITKGTEKLGLGHPITLDAKNSLLLLLHEQMNLLVEAGALCEDLVNTAVEHLGPTHKSTIVYMKNAATVIKELDGREGDCKQLYEAVIAAQTETLGPGHEDTLTTKTLLAMLLYSNRTLVEPAELAAVCTDLAISSIENMGPTDTNTTLLVGSAVTVLSGLDGHVDTCKQLYESLIAAQTETLGPRHEDILGAKNKLQTLLNQKMGQLTNCASNVSSLRSSTLVKPAAPTGMVTTMTAEHYCRHGISLAGLEALHSMY